MLQGWSVILQGIRLNGIEIPVAPGRYRTDAQHVAVLDSGAPSIYLPWQTFQLAVNKFHGLIFMEPHEDGDRILFECARAQLLELQIHGRWFTVDALDMLVPNSRRIVNGTAM